MGLFDSIKRKLNIGGPALTITNGPFDIDVNDKELALVCAITNSATKLHVDKIRVLLSLIPEPLPGKDGRVQSAATTDTGRMPLFYKQSVYTNLGKGWDIQPGESRKIALAVDLNNPATDTSIASLLRNAKPGTRLMNLAVLADSQGIYVKPQDMADMTVRISPLLQAA